MQLFIVASQTWHAVCLTHGIMDSTCLMCMISLWMPHSFAIGVNTNFSRIKISVVLV